MTLDKIVEVFVNTSTSGGLIVSVNDEDEIDTGSSTASLDLNQETEFKLSFVKGPETLIDLNAIVSLNLSNSSLDYLPDSCGSLKLVNFNLSHNKFQDVPHCLYSGLQFLENLDLSYNKLTLFSQVPACFKRLRVLYLNNNRFPNVPLWIQQVKCFNLEEFNYSNNEVIGFKKSKFHVTSSYCLKRLEMRNCLLRSQDMRYLKLIRSLQYLDISNVSEKDCNGFSSMDEFCSMFIEPRWDDCLRVLNLNNLMIYNLPEEIKCLVNLEELYLRHNYFVNIPSGLTHLKKLKLLDISHNELGSLDVDVSNWQNLECLKASNNYIIKIGNLLSLNLKSLDLYENFIDCNFEFKSNIIEVDLERNCLDTDELQIPNYDTMKNALRIKYCCQTRLSGPKLDEDTNWPDNDSQLSSERSFEYENNCENAVDGCFTNEEDCWDPVNNGEIFDNGCTLSDNEWKGYEEVRVIPKQKRYKPVVRSSSGNFEDI